MAVSRAERRAERAPRVAVVFAEGDQTAALDLLEITELAWNDCYGGITPSEAQVDDMLLLSDGTLPGLITACRLAVSDRRDLQIAADARRNHT